MRLADRNIINARGLKTYARRAGEAVPRSFIDLINTFLEIKFAEAMKSRGKDAEA